MAEATLITSNAVTEMEVYRSETPPHTRTHCPIPHGEFIDQVKAGLDFHDWTINSSEYGLYPGRVGEIKYPEAGMFGVMKISKEGVETADGGYELALGIRNSHDKSFAAKVAVGLIVMVCENLDFYGEYVTGHKNTPHARDHLLARIFGMIRKIDGAHDNHAEQMELYRWRQISDTETHDIIVRCVDDKVFPWAYGEKVLKEFRNPRHEEFKDRNVWGFNNAVTEILKARNTRYLSDSTRKLHNLLGEVCLN
jgi:hypothetical protein